MKYHCLTLAGLCGVLLTESGAQASENFKEPGAATAPSQSADVPSDYGTTTDGVTTFGFAAFTPTDASTSFASDLVEGLRWSSAPLIAPVRGIPNGAVITQLAFYFRDFNVLEGFSGELCRSWVHSSTGDAPGRDCPVSIGSVGSPGDSVIIESPVGLEFREQLDVDNDGTLDTVQYYLQAVTVSADESTGFRMAQIRWRRQVSPAPAVPTFNDVPTGHPQFQFIEALVASGITVGCGSGNYCPDNAVTRGQMAVFLAKALGLHWPAL